MRRRNYARTSCRRCPLIARAPLTLTVSMRRRIGLDDAEEWLKDHGRFKLRALVIEAHNIERLLRYLGEPLEPPRRSPARDPRITYARPL